MKFSYKPTKSVPSSERGSIYVTAALGRYMYTKGKGNGIFMKS